MTADLNLDLPDELEALIATLPVLSDGEDPAPYPQDDLDARDGAQDDLDELGGPGDAPRTSKEAIRLGREWIAGLVYFGVGYCLKTIRSLFGVLPLDPDAETGWENALHPHRETDPMKIPWGVPVWWVNGRYGHVALSLGKGRCLTTDYVNTGRLGIARIADLGPWCGGQLVGWTQDINRVVVWKPKVEVEPFDIDDRVALVKLALQRARQNDASPARIRGLRKWLEQLRTRRATIRAKG